jgi:hypothetical protein
MEKWAELLALFFLVILIAAIISISGCTSNDQAQTSPPDAGSYQISQQDNSAQNSGNPQMGGGPNGRFGNRTGGFPGNLTQEQRQQMFAERTRLATAACENKAEGESCEMQNQRGNMPGACKTQNGTLMCSFGDGGFNSPRRGGQ